MPAVGRVGDKASCPADAHGCNACAHSVIGPASAGSPNVMVNGLAVLRVGDPGTHAACCGPNTWSASSGSSTVIINGLPAHRQGDKTTHCGGSGQLIEGSPDVIIGDSTWSRAAKTVKVEEAPTEQLVLELKRLYHDDEPVQGATFEVELLNGQILTGTLDAHGVARLDIPARPKRVRFGPDARPYARVDDTRNPEYKEQMSESDIDDLVAKNLSGV